MCSVMCEWEMLEIKGPPMTLTHGRPDPAHFDIRLAVEANPSHHGNVGSGWFGEVYFSKKTD